MRSPPQDNVRFSKNLCLAFKMKVIIQHPFTLSYLQNPGKWTKLPDAALTFENSRAAINFCLANDLSDMQVVLKFPEDRFDIQLPITSTLEMSKRNRDFAIYA